MISRGKNTEIQNIPFQKKKKIPPQRSVFAEGILLFPFQAENLWGPKMSPSVGGTSWETIKARVPGAWDGSGRVLCDKNMQQM